jgi:hypothetical protein
MPARPGTPRLTTQFDQSYRCTTCDSDNLDPDTDLDQDTWTCSTCHQPVLVRMDDESGLPAFLVERVPARALIAGERVLVETEDGHRRAYRSAEVKASSPATHARGRWHLALEQQTAERVDPDRYYNRTL